MLTIFLYRVMRRLAFNPPSPIGYSFQPIKPHASKPSNENNQLDNVPSMTQQVTLSCFVSIPEHHSFITAVIIHSIFVYKILYIFIFVHNFISHVQSIRTPSFFPCCSIIYMEIHKVWFLTIPGCFRETQRFDTCSLLRLHFRILSK